MDLRIKRTYYSEYTTGKLYINDVYFCDTLEDPNRDLNFNGTFDNGEIKIPGDTCIPVGTYTIIMTKSPKFKITLPLLLNVPHFIDIRIHSGNHKGHTGGCILVGDLSGTGYLVSSRKRLDALVSILLEADRNKEKIIIKIE